MAHASKGTVVKNVREVAPPVARLPKKSVRERLKRIANEITNLVKEMEG